MILLVAVQMKKETKRFWDYYKKAITLIINIYTINHSITTYI